jgi:hypothetical protein
LSMGYDRWKMQHGISLPAPAAPTGAPAAQKTQPAQHRKAVRRHKRKAKAE